MDKTFASGSGPWVQNRYLAAALAVLLLSTLGFQALAQADTAAQRVPPTTDQDGLRCNLTRDGELYFKATFLNQAWVRFNESNSGTTVLGERAPTTFDVGLRRTRIQLFGQVSKYAFLYFQFGQNNFNFLSGNGGNRKVQPFFHDAFCELTPFNQYLKIGAGLTITSGLSRFRQPSIGTIMTMDVPVFAQTTVDQVDEFSRMLSITARGQVGKFDYRLVFSDPFPITSNGQSQPPIGFNASFAQRRHSKQGQGYVMYQFLEQEPHTTPYMAGTFLGRRQVFNLAAGVIYQPRATWTHLAKPDAQPGFDTSYHKMLHLCVEAFYDAPLDAAKGTALSSYGGVFNLDYGPGYLRNNGIMNPADGTVQGSSVNGPGNAYPMFGTGQVAYAQVGYLMRHGLLGTFGTLMPYVSGQYARFSSRLASPVAVLNAGVNWMLDGHRHKITLDYQNRPDYRAAPGGKPVVGSRRSAVTLQYQIFI